MAENTQDNLPSVETTSTRSYPVYFTQTTNANLDTSRTLRRINIHLQRNQKRFEYISNDADSLITVLPGALRFVGKYFNRADDDTLFCVIVSYLHVKTNQQYQEPIPDSENNTNDGEVTNLFIESEDRANDQELFEELRSLLMVKFYTVGNGDAINSASIEVMMQQPLYVGKLMVEVSGKDKAEQKGLFSGEALLLVDMECMCIYKDSLKEPYYRLSFLKQAGPMVVEKIIVLHLEHVIAFQTDALVFTIIMPKNEKFDNVLSHLNSKLKHLLSNPSIYDYIVMCEKKERCESRRQQALIQKSNARDFLGQLEFAKREFTKNEAYQKEWVGYQCHINELEQADSLPEADFDHAALNAESMEDVKRVFSRIVASITDDGLPMALSTMKACRKFFSESSDMYIRHVFMDVDSDILKHLYFRQKLGTGRGGLNLQVQGTSASGFELPRTSHSIYNNQLGWDANMSSAIASGRTASNPDYDLALIAQTEVRQLQHELDTAGQHFDQSEDFQTIWMTYLYDLEELERSGDVPESDFASGGMDNGDVQHLKMAISDIQDQLKDNDIRIAVSRVRACRMFFIDSPIRRIRQIFENETDTSLLKKFYFRSMLF